MKNIARTVKIALLLASALVVLDSRAQLRIDWQQCYGGLGSDSPYDFLSKDGGYIIVGKSDLGSGMISCGTQGSVGNWVFCIGENHEIVSQDCFSGYHGVLEAKDGDGGYYFHGKDYFPSSDNYGLWVIRTDENFNVIWDRLLGCEEHFFPYKIHSVATDDGGIVCTTIKAEWACGDASQYYGGIDIWVVKLDKNGGMEWEVTLGTEGGEGDHGVLVAEDGGLFVLCSATLSGVNGTIENCARPNGYVDGLIVKMNARGEVEWNRCYGGFYHDAILDFIELPDGYLMGGRSSSTDGDLQGAGYHPGHWHGQPWMPLTGDVWLLRTDLDGNVLWSKCYGGTKEETIVKVFENEDGGFTVFGATMSLDGDSQSAHNLKPAYNLEIGNKLWVFRTDSSGNLLWERAIGTQTEAHEYLADVIKHNDREYTILAECGSSNGEMPCGDYDCTNDTAYLMHAHNNYWVLHVTDTVDYSTIQVAEQPDVPDGVVRVYPSPATHQVTVVGIGIRQVELLNILGQAVLSASYEPADRVTLEMSALKAGVYFVRVTEAGGNRSIRKIIKE